MRDPEKVTDTVETVLGRGLKKDERALVLALVEQRDAEWVLEVKRLFRDFWWGTLIDKMPGGPGVVHGEMLVLERRFLDRLEMLKLGRTHYDGRRA